MSQISPEYQAAEFDVPPCAHDTTRASWTRETGSFLICLDCNRALNVPELDPRTRPYDWDESWD